jgi:hypothetical protein
MEKYFNKLSHFKLSQTGRGVLRYVPETQLIKKLAMDTGKQEGVKK